MKEFTIFVISMTILAAYAYISYVLVLSPNDVTATATLVYGSFSALAGSVITYWFGSSKGSSEKDATIANFTKDRHL